MELKEAVRGTRSAGKEDREPPGGTRRELLVTVKKTGGIWHGYLEGHPEVDERALTEEMARVKVERIVQKLDAEG